jgi:hypothetical protein
MGEVVTAPPEEELAGFTGLKAAIRERIDNDTLARPGDLILGQ